MPDFASSGQFRDVMILGRRIAAALERIAEALERSATVDEMENDEVQDFDEVYPDLPELLTVAEAQAVLRVSRNTIYALLREERIPSQRYGHTWRIPKSALVALREQRTNGDH